jgi:hypothetical protein
VETNCPDEDDFHYQKKISAGFVRAPRRPLWRRTILKHRWKPAPGAAFAGIASCQLFSSQGIL